MRLQFLHVTAKYSATELPPSPRSMNLLSVDETHEWHLQEGFVISLENFKE